MMKSRLKIIKKYCERKVDEKWHFFIFKYFSVFYGKVHVVQSLWMCVFRNIPHCLGRTQGRSWISCQERWAVSRLPYSSVDAGYPREGSSMGIKCASERREKSLEKSLQSLSILSPVLPFFPRHSCRGYEYRRSRYYQLSIFWCIGYKKNSNSIKAANARKILCFLHTLKIPMVS